MYADTVVQYDINPDCLRFSNAAAINAAAKAADKTVHGLIAVDTGMGRIGYLLPTKPRQPQRTLKNTGLENFKIKAPVFPYVYRRCAR